MTDAIVKVPELLRQAEQHEDVARYEGLAGEALLRARSVEIRSDDDERNAAGLRNAIRDDLVRCEEARKALVGPLQKHVRFIDSLFKAPKEVFGEAVAVLDAKLLEKESERQRQHDAASRIAEEIRAKEIRRLQDLADRNEKREELARVDGAHDAAEVFRARAEAYSAKVDSLMLAAPAPAVPAGPESIGISVTWDAEVVDMHALLLAVLEGRAPKEAVLPNILFLRGFARGTKGSASIPGVRLFAKPFVRKAAV